MKENAQEKYLRRKARQAEKALIKEREEAERLAQQKKLDERFMRRAITQAKKAAAIGEVPIGCVIVHDGRVIASGYNRRNTDHSTLSHAEITAIKRAARVLGDWRLEDCTIYITLEPCQMCAGAIVQARCPRAVIGAMNPKAGCAGSIIDMFSMKEFNHRVQTERGVLGEECSELLKKFFEELRAGRAQV